MNSTSIDLRRRRVVAFIGASVVTAGAAGATQAGLPAIEVWKDPNCGCCKDWIAHVGKAGFPVSVHESGNAAMRQRLGMPERYGSCHTARVGSYAIEGHVPAREIQRLLRERPDAAGLAVPGMPIGSPGMDGPEYGNRKDPYEVLLVRRDGSARTFQTYR